MKYTKYEKARIVGARALQLSMGAPFALKLCPKRLEEMQYSTLRIAQLEFDKDAIPITVKRRAPGSKPNKQNLLKTEKKEQEKYTEDQEQ